MAGPLRIAICAATVVIAPLLSHGSALKGDRSLLDDVIDTHRSNWGGIHSWRGEVFVEDIRVAETTDQTEWTSKASFVYRVAPYALRWNWKVEAPEGADPVPVPTLVSNGLVKEGRQYLLDLNRQNGTESLHKSIRVSVHAPSSMGPLSQAFDPAYFTRHQGDNLETRFSFFRDNADNLGSDGWSVTRNGSHVVLGLDTPSLLNRYTVDLAQGGNLISYEGEERKDSKPSVRVQWSWVYKKVDGFWLPNEMMYHLEHFDDPLPGDDEGRSVSSTLRGIRWTSSVVNEPINDAEFALTAIGIKDGDIIADTMTGEIYKFGQEPERKASATWRMPLITANIAALIIICAALIWRRRYRQIA